MQGKQLPTRGGSMFTGHQLREYRKKRTWTQKQLGEQTCMSRAAIARIEADNRIIDSFEQLKLFQLVLRIPYHIIGFIPIETEDQKCLQPGSTASTCAACRAK